MGLWGCQKTPETTRKLLDQSWSPPLPDPASDNDQIICRKTLARRECIRCTHESQNGKSSKG